MPNLTRRNTKLSPVKLWKLDDKPLFFGRTEGHVQVDDEKMSRKHFVIVMKDGACVIQDLKSKNGTFVNGQRITETVLNLWDTIQAGRTTFVFEQGLSTIIKILEKELQSLEHKINELGSL